MTRYRVFIEDALHHHCLTVVFKKARFYCDVLVIVAFRRRIFLVLDKIMRESSREYHWISPRKI